VIPIVQPATLEDAAALARIHGASFDEPWDEDWFRRLLDRPGALAFVAKNAAATDLQAFILIQVAADESEILSIGTAPAWRRSGLARELVVEAAVKAAQRQAKAMFLEVAEDNFAALALYRSCGFTMHGRRRAYCVRNGAQAVDALMLGVKLPLESAMGMARRLD
jgi:ribosomal-protein-alanine N-acetyltransferase